MMGGIGMRSLGGIGFNKPKPTTNSNADEAGLGMFKKAKGTIGGRKLPI